MKFYINWFKLDDGRIYQTERNKYYPACGTLEQAIEDYYQELMDDNYSHTQVFSTATDKVEIIDIEEIIEQQKEEAEAEERSLEEHCLMYSVEMRN